MKKKIFLSLLLIVSLFMLSACRKETSNTGNDNKDTNTTEKQIEKLMIDGYDLTLSETSSFSKISFKYPKGAEISNPVTSLVINYQKKDSDENLFRVAMGDMYGTNIDSSMRGLVKQGTKAINGVDWSIYTDANGNRSYGINVDYSNIVIGFIYDTPNIYRFEEEFMNNVILNK